MAKAVVPFIISNHSIVVLNLLKSLKSLLAVHLYNQYLRFDFLKDTRTFFYRAKLFEPEKGLCKLESIYR